MRFIAQFKSKMVYQAEKEGNPSAKMPGGWKDFWLLNGRHVSNVRIDERKSNPSMKMQIHLHKRRVRELEAMARLRSD